MRTHFYYDVLPGSSGSVFCGTNRKEADNSYHCAHQPQCNLFITHECECLKTPLKLSYGYDKASSRYRKHFKRESRNDPFSKVKHDLIMMYIIHSKYTQNKTEYLFVTDRINEVHQEVKEMNVRYGKEYWTFTSFIEYNSKILSLEKHYKDELLRIAQQEK